MVSHGHLEGRMGYAKAPRVGLGYAKAPRVGLGYAKAPKEGMGTLREEWVTRKAPKRTNG